MTIKGYVADKYPQNIPSKWDFVFVVGTIGTTRSNAFSSLWGGIPSNKRGLICKPELTPVDNAMDNSSKFYELVSEVNPTLNIPFILDIFEVAPENRFELMDIITFGKYLKDRLPNYVKPLLRINLGTWNDWYANARAATNNILGYFELLLVQPGAEKPDVLTGYGTPRWWEYQYGKIAFDPSGEWEDSPNKPVETPVEEPETPAPPVVNNSVSVPKKWRISLLGGLLKGTIEAVDDQE